MNLVFQKSSQSRRGFGTAVAELLSTKSKKDARQWKSSFSSPRISAFTLVELMVAMTILSLMILFLFSVFDQATKAWQASEKKVDAFREARAALYVMRRDLGGAVIQTNLPFNSNLAGGSLPIPIDGQMASTNTLFFVSAQPSAAQGEAGFGDLCAVGYYVAWSTNDFQPTNSGTTDIGVSRSYNLFRYFKDSTATYTNMSLYWSNLGTTTNFSNYLKFLFPEASSAPLRGDEVLARNVTGFSITPYYRNGTNASTPLEAISGAITNRLAYLEINLSVINYDTAAKLGDSAGNGANWNTNSATPVTKTLLEKNEQDFYTRIPFKQ